MNVETLADLASALGDERDEAVHAALERVAAEFDALREEEDAYVRTAGTVRERTAGDERAPTVARELRQATGRTQAARARTLDAVRRYLDGQATGEAAAATVTDQVEQFEAFERKKREFDDAKREVSVPGILAASAPRGDVVPKGQRLEVPVRIRNPGGEPLEDVSLAVAETSGSLALSRDRIDRLAPGGSTTVTLEGQPADGGTARVSVEASDSSATAETQFVVRTKGEFVGSAISEIHGILTVLTAVRKEAAGPGSPPDGGNGGNGGNGGADRGAGPLAGMENQLETITKKLARTFDRIGETGGDAVDRQLGAVVEQVEAFENHVRAQTGKHVPEKESAEIRNRTAALIDVVEDATLAEP